MATQLAERRGTVTATLNYLDPAGPCPVAYTFEPPPGTPWRSGTYVERLVAIEDARELRGTLSLDEHGFALVRHRTRVVDFYDPAEVKARYFAEAERLVREATGATRVLAFDHNVRSAPKAQAGTDGAREPVRRVHNDFTAKSGAARAHAELAARGEDAETLLRHRFAIVNVWRPIRGPVLDVPLAVADARSIAPRDLIAQDLVYRDRVGETYAVAFNPSHRWFYAPEMQRDEALLIKVFDSDARVARFSAHSAFDDPTTPPGGPPRESIEVRTLALFLA